MSSPATSINPTDKPRLRPGRFLLPEEYPRLGPIFAQYGAPVPSPLASAVYVIEDEAGEICHAHALMMMWHGEPLWSREDVRGLGLWRESSRAVVDLFEGTDGAVYSFSDGPRSDHMLEEFGMEELPYKVFIRRFEGGEK